MAGGQTGFDGGRTLTQFADIPHLLAASAFMGSLLFYVPLWGPQLVFRHPEPKGESEAFAARFSLLDGFALMLLLGVVNGLASRYRDDAIEMNSGIPLVFANLLVVVMWGKCQGFLAKHRIDRPWKRLLMQVVLFPLAVLLIGEMIASIVLASLELYSQGLRAFTPTVVAAAMGLVASMPGLAVVRWAFRRWVVAASP